MENNEFLKNPQAASGGASPRAERGGLAAGGESVVRQILAGWVDERLDALTPGGEWRPDTIGGLARLWTRRNAQAKRRRWWTVGAATATAAGIVFMAFPAPRALAQRCLECFSASGIVQAALKPASARKAAPDFTLADASGKAVRLSTFKGKVVLLDFWATWCGGCKVEIPWFVEFQQRYQNRDFVVLGVSFDEDGWKVVKPFMDAKKINYRIVIGDNHIATLYGGLEALPVTLLIDKSGRIASTHVGLGNKKDFESEIETLLNARASR